MKAEELRIGNWLRHNNAIIDISEWCYRGEGEFQWELRDWQALSECTMFIENLEPIPITKEWLVKFGFFDWEDGSFDYEDDFEFSINLEDQHITWLNQVYRSSYCHHPLPKYVHQLQNLYFALTGEELSYEL